MSTTLQPTREKLRRRLPAPTVSIPAPQSAQRRAWKLRCLQYSLVSGCLLFLALPWFPLHPAANENDTIRIAYGAIQLANNSLLDHVYRYDCQPGTYATIVLLAKLPLLNLEPLLAFRIATIASFLVLLATATFVLHQLLDLPKWFCVLSLLLFQEIFVASYYGNSSMLAAPWAMSAVALLVRKQTHARCLLAGALYGVGVWMRFDLILICLVFPVLLWPRNRGQWLRVGLLTSTAALVSNLLIWASGASVLGILKSFLEHQGIENLPWTLRCYASVFTGLIVVSGGYGLWRMARERSWRLLSLVGAGLLPTVLAFGDAMTCSKYLLYALPFVALASSLGIWFLLQSKHRACHILMESLFLAQYLLNPCWFLESQGQIHTDDGFRRAGPIYASVLDWSKFNRETLEATLSVRTRLENWVQQRPLTVFAVQEATHEFLVPYHLLHDQFLVTQSATGNDIRTVTFERPGKRVIVLKISPSRSARLTSAELVELGIPRRAKLRCIGNTNAQLFPTTGKKVVTGTGKFGSYLVTLK